MFCLANVEPRVDIPSFCYTAGIDVASPADLS